MLADTVRKHEAYLEETEQFVAEQVEADELSGDSTADPVELESADHADGDADDMKAAMDWEIEVDPNRDTHGLRAHRVWDRRSLTVCFGDKEHSVLLEDCSAGCECWTDDAGGCRIGYIVEYLLQIPLEKQGWIVGAKMVDYFDENAAESIWEHHSTLIVYRKL